MAGKKQFFAQYWGQEVLKRKEFEHKVTIKGRNIELYSNLDSFYLELKDVEDIMDFEAHEMRYSNAKDYLNYYYSSCTLLVDAAVCE